jgi:hypothetical protein
MRPSDRTELKMTSWQMLYTRLIKWARTRPDKREYTIWSLSIIVLYLIWTLAVKPVAIDFNIYRFAGYAFRDGLSLYDQSPAVFA